MNYSSATRALDPDAPIVLLAIQLAASLVLRDEGHEGGEHGRHGAGTLPHPGPRSNRSRCQSMLG